MNHEFEPRYPLQFNVDYSVVVAPDPVKIIVRDRYSLVNPLDFLVKWRYNDSMMNNIYSKYEGPEEDEIAYAKVQSGEWDLARFKEYVRCVEKITWQDATADESF